MTDELILKTEEYILDNGLLNDGDTVIAGVSGGVDSISMLAILDELKNRHHWNLLAVHINHGIRGTEADEDEAFVRDFCKARKIRGGVRRVDVPALADARRQGIEECARYVRREVFEECAAAAERTASDRADSDRGSVRIATAHHRDDDVETFIFNLCRGSSLKGLSGMRPASGKYIRPLLFASRDEIEAFAKRSGLAWREDSTNTDTGYTRNLIRREVLPILTGGVNTASIAHIRRAAEQIRLASDLIEEQADVLFDQYVVKSDGRLMIPEELVCSRPEVLINAVIHRCICEMAGQSKDIALIHLTSAAELFARQVGRVIDLPCGLVCRRVYGGIEFAEKGSETRSAGFDDYEFKSRFPDPGEPLNLRDDPYTKYFDYGIIGENSSFRTRQSGDYIIINQDGGRAKLQDWFVDHKIPQEDRDRIPLLADGHHVFWIVGHRQSSDSLLTGQTEQVIEWRARIRHGY